MRAVARRSAGTIDDSGLAALVDALAAYGLAPVVGHDGTPTLTLGESRFDVEVRSVVTAAEARVLAEQWRRRAQPVVLVADRISEEGRDELSAAGVHYFDRRGPLRIVSPPLVVDATVPATASSGTSTPPLSGQVAKEVAIACLLTPDEPHGVREVASYIDRSPGAVSEAMAALRAEGLLTSENEPLIPDLFHELVTVWRVHRVALATPPTHNGRGPLAADLGLDELTGPGWALAETVAASAWGMPVVARGDYPPDFYVPTEAHLQRAVRLLGEASTHAEGGCTVAVAPVRLACLRRLEPPAGSWPLANHIVVALDIAQDKARGLEILESWYPEDITRAW